MTNIDLFTFPAYLRGRSPMPYVKHLTGGTGVWMGHKIDDSSNVRFTPAYVDFECDNMLLMMDREPIDQADVTSLLYMSMKPTDTSSKEFMRCIWLSFPKRDEAEDWLTGYHNLEIGTDIFGGGRERA